MDIATQTETVTTTTKTFIVKLTEAELTAALVDAKPLQRELRKARNAGQDQHSNWATHGHAPHTATVKVKRGRPAKAEKKIPRPSAQRKAADSPEPSAPARRGWPAGVQTAQPCPYGCGQDVKPSGLGRHRLKCPRYQLHHVAEQAKSAALDD